MQTNLLIGLGAGFVSAMLFASASTGTLLGLFVLFFLSPMPIAVAGLGWGWRAALVASIAGAIGIGMIGNWRASLFHAVAIGAPTAVLSYYCLLNRDVRTDRGEAATEWYPLDRIVALAALMGGALGAFALLTTATDMDALRKLLGATVERMLKQPAGAPAPVGMPANLEPAQIAGLTNLMIGMFTISISTMWLAMAALNMWLAAHVVARSNLLVRPWPDLNQLRLPPALPMVLAAALLCTFLAGFPGLIAAGFAGALILAYVFVGLAIIHSITRGQSLRPMILFATYAILILFVAISGPALALLALAEPFFPLRKKSPQGPAPPNA
jgi:Predicted membrane protein (DUF2232)